MFNSQWLFMFSWLFFVIGSNASSASFIDKCVWHDKACLVKSSNKALPHFCAGLPGLVPALDPLEIKQVKVDEAGLDLVFNDLKLIGACQCKVVNAERNVEKSYMIVELECPINVQGSYKASGNVLLVPVEGNGPFHVKSDKVFISVKMFVDTIVGPDGEKYWKLGKYEHSYDFKEKAHMKFENLYNGDVEKARPITELLQQSWKELVNIFGKGIVKEFIHKVLHAIKRFLEQKPVSQLEHSQT